MSFVAEPHNGDEYDPGGGCLLENKRLVLKLPLRLCIFAYTDFLEA